MIKKAIKKAWKEMRAAVKIILDNVFLTERTGGPFFYVLSLGFLATLPFWVLAIFTAELLMAVDDSFTK